MKWKAKLLISLRVSGVLKIVTVGNMRVFPVCCKGVLSNYKMLACLFVCVSVCGQNPEFPEWQNRHYLSNPLTDMAKIQNLGYKGQ